MVVDATEVAAVQKKQRTYYSGKHKRQMLKAQVVIDLEWRQFVAVTTIKGRVHDLHLFKHTQVRFADSLLCLADKGYQGKRIAKLHPDSTMPHKKPPRKCLSDGDQQANRTLVQSPIKVE